MRYSYFLRFREEDGAKLHADLNATPLIRVLSRLSKAGTVFERMTEVFCGSTLCSMLCGQSSMIIRCITGEINPDERWIL